MVQDKAIILFLIFIPLVFSQLVPEKKIVVRRSCNLPKTYNDQNILHVYEPDACYNNNKYFCDRDDGKPKMFSTCGKPENEYPEELETECDQYNLYYYECIPYPIINIEDYVQENSCSDENCQIRIEPTIYIKPFTCINIDGNYYKYIIAGPYVGPIYYNDCDEIDEKSTETLYKVNDTVYDEDAGMFKKFSFTVDNAIHEYLFHQYIHFVSYIIKSDYCFYGSKIYVYKKNDVVLMKEYSDIDCKGTIVDIRIVISDIVYGINSLPQSKNYYYFTQYESFEECMERNHAFYVMISSDKDMCDEFGQSFEFNQTHARSINYQCSEYDYDNWCLEYDCSTILSIEEFKFNECLKASESFYVLFFQNVYNYFENITCDIDMNCKVENTIHLIEEVIIESNVTITNSSIIIIEPGNNFGIIVGENGNLNIEGGHISLNLDDESEFEDFLSNFDDTDEVILPLIKGRYSGKFDSIGVEKPQNSDKCEGILGDLEYKENMVNALFSLDKSNCGLKWWVILLIVISIFAVIIAIVFIIIYLKYKKVLSSKRNVKGEDKESVDMDTYVQNDKSVYEGKGKVNPLYEA